MTVKGCMMHLKEGKKHATNDVIDIVVKKRINDESKGD